jgi:hypothetical protein
VTQIVVPDPYAHRVEDLAEVEDLADVVAIATAHAAETGMTLVPAAPLRDSGPEVSFTPDKLDLPAFLALASKLGGGVLYCGADPLDPEGDTDLVDPPSHLYRYTGRVGMVTLAFAVNGLVHFWERRTAWYDDVENAKDAGVHQGYSYGDAGGIDDEPDDQPDAETRGRMTRALAAKLVAMPQFRAAKGGARQRIGRMAVPDETPSWVTWDAVRQACDQADALSSAHYAELTAELDDLAAHLLSDPNHERASSPAARRRAAEQFLISRADGFSPPTHVRDELYARAQKLSKANRSPGLF